MNYSSMPSSELVQLAYRLLKQDTYYDKMDLFLRRNFIQVSFWTHVTCCHSINARSLNRKYIQTA